MTNKWQALTPGMFSGLAGPLWLATLDGEVLIGEYEWRQGWSPDGFNTEERGRMSAKEITHVMACTRPVHPSKENACSGIP
jgi:hypothetical protein